jgi:hypothetical protein
MLKEALEYLNQKFTAANGSELVKLHEAQYLKTAAGVSPVIPLYAEPLIFSRLQALVDYIQSLADPAAGSAGLGDTSSGQCFVHVASPTLVVFERALDEYRKREQLARVEYNVELEGEDDGSDSVFGFGQYFDPESFNIFLKTKFAEQNDDREKVIGIAGNVATGDSVEADDDGFSQTVTVKAGVTMKSRESIVNPYTLSPYRTFPEVKQPASSFILRARGMGAGSTQLPRFALYETDNGAWKIDAIKVVGDWLKDKLAGKVKVFA